MHSIILQYPFLRREVPAFHHPIYVTLQLVLGYVYHPHMQLMYHHEGILSHACAVTVALIVYLFTRKEVKRNKIIFHNPAALYTISCSILLPQFRTRDIQTEFVL